MEKSRFFRHHAADHDAIYALKIEGVRRKFPRRNPPHAAQLPAIASRGLGEGVTDIDQQVSGHEDMLAGGSG